MRVINLPSLCVSSSLQVSLFPRSATSTWLPFLLFYPWAGSHWGEYSQVFTAKSIIKRRWWCTWFFFPPFEKSASLCSGPMNTLLLLHSFYSLFLRFFHPQISIFLWKPQGPAGSWSPAFLAFLSFGGVIEVRGPFKYLSDPSVC